MTGMQLEWVDMGGVDEGGVFDSTEVVEGANYICGIGARQEGGIRENVENMLEGRNILCPLRCAETYPSRRSRSAMV